MGYDLTNNKGEKVGHVSTLARQTWDAVNVRLSKCDRHETRYLSRRICGLCETPLDRGICGKIPFFGDDKACTEEQRIARIDNCLEDFEPFISARKAHWSAIAMSTTYRIMYKHGDPNVVKSWYRRQLERHDRFNPAMFDRELTLFERRELQATATASIK